MKTYFVRYQDGQEEKVKADDVRESLRFMSFYRRKRLVLAVAVSEISRVGEKRFEAQMYEFPEVEYDDVISYLKSKGINAPAIEMEANRAVTN